MLGIALSVFATVCQVGVQLLYCLPNVQPILVASCSAPCIVMSHLYWTGNLEHIRYRAQDGPT